MNLFLKDQWRFLTLLLVIIIAHSSLLFPETLENPDASIIYPVLEKVTSIFDYFSKLAAFETIDFQPVRDLTFFIDLWWFDHFSFEITIILNCFIWALACFNLLKVAEENTETEKITSLLLILCFAVYPVFLQTVNWGIARKHLLALLFTLLATREFFKWIKGGGKEFKIVVWYTLSLLSLPISIGWPVWAFIYCKYYQPGDRDKKKLFSVLGLIMFLLLLINWAYYKSSYTFLEVYPRKVSNFDPIMIAINMGQQFWQLIYPYQLSFFYNFDHKALWGLGLFLVAMIVFFLKYRKNTYLWMWVLFGACHAVVILSTPEIYYDSYVVFPGAALFICIVKIWSSKIKSLKFLLLLPLIFFSAFTFSQNSYWKTSKDFFQRNFENEKSCSNALQLSTPYYLAQKKLPNDLYEFIQMNSCLIPFPGDTVKMIRRKVLIESMSMFNEDEIDHDYREERLQELGKREFYPMAMYIAFLVKEDRKAEVESVSQFLNEKLKGSGQKIDYDPIIMSVVPVYCKRHRLEQCLTFLSYWKKKMKRTY